MIKMHDFIENEEKSCKYKWVNSFMSIFFFLYVNEILLIENDIPYITRNKGFTVIIFFIKYFEKVSFILEMKIYRDRSKRLLELSQSNIYRVFMSRICSIMYTMYETGYGILTRIVSGYLQDPS